ncbi:MAG: putative pyridoxal phosphate-containing protein affecting Ile and Val metabolism [Candidatus Methanohalarchaeum thermophilum]|uniref:Pyridoxal phosphate homeostasis protein n=1 Tax=Methanohalarchaeum thermophilum TaxID=1903181 RepID=A0A1Q6DS33_METT1|nr:MAG: putative pyridoxal phosphate-containing protein affecting Ile and Val metabolism [Candidatus Methanohalarchaeum thermophilum]
MVEIYENYKELRNEIKDDVKILVASKGRNSDEVREAINAGARHIGENYIYPEATNKHEKLTDLSDSVTWHVIGHLQTNKINKALPIFDVIQTVESGYRAKNINKRLKREEMREKRTKNGLSETISVFVEVNISREESKYGIEPEFEKIRSLLNKIKKMEYLVPDGLMTMGRKTSDMEIKRKEFRKMKELFDRSNKEIDNLELSYLSMGMTNTYKTAIEEGANMVRVGRGIFGERN